MQALAVKGYMPEMNQVDDDVMAMLLKDKRGG